MIRIFNNKKEVDIKPGAIRPAGRVLGLLRFDRHFKNSFAGLEGIHENVSEEYRKEIRDANLEAECVKARVQIEMQKQRSL